MIFRSYATVDAGDDGMQIDNDENEEFVETRKKGDHQYGRRGGAQPREDFFETPYEIIDIMMKYIAEYDNGRISSEFVIFDPCCGDEAIGNHFRKFYPHTIYLYRTRLKVY